MQVGHIQLATDGRMLRIDDAMCDMIAHDGETLIGRSVLDITYPPDRDGCQRCMQTLHRTREPFAVVKRMLHADGRPVWVANTMALASFGDGQESVLATITRRTDPDDAGAPPELLRQARLLIADGRDRRTWLASPIFIDPPLTILLSAYVAEAEGTLADLDTMADDAGVAKAVVASWIRALADQGLIEPEEGAATARANAFGYRLTQRSMERCEQYLMHRVRVRDLCLNRA